MIVPVFLTSSSHALRAVHGFRANTKHKSMIQSNIARFRARPQHFHRAKTKVYNVFPAVVSLRFRCLQTLRDRYQAGRIVCLSVCLSHLQTWPELKKMPTQILLGVQLSSEGGGWNRKSCRYMYDRVITKPAKNR